MQPKRPAWQLVLGVLEEERFHKIESPVGEVNKEVRKRILKQYKRTVAMATISDVLKMLEFNGDIIRRKGANKTFAIWLSKKYLRDVSTMRRIRTNKVLPPFDSNKVQELQTLTRKDLEELKGMLSQTMLRMSEMLVKLDDSEKHLLGK